MMYISVFPMIVYHGIWLGLSNPNDEINLYHRYSGDISSCVILRHLTANNPDAMVMFTLNDDYRLYYKGYSNFKEFVSDGQLTQINPTLMTIWEGRTYPIIIQNIRSTDTIFVALVERIDETMNGINDTMKMAIWTNPYNITTEDYAFDDKFNTITPNFKELQYKRSDNSLVINSLSLKTWSTTPNVNTHMITNWIEPNIIIGIRRTPTNTDGIVIAIPNAHRVMGIYTLVSDVNTYLCALVIGKEPETNEIFIQWYRSTSTLDALFSTSNTATSMDVFGSRMMSGICLDNFPISNTYIENRYGVIANGMFNYYSGGRLIVIGYNVYLTDKSLLNSRLILKLQRWDHWMTGSVNTHDKVYVIRGKEYTLVISYDPDKVYNTETIAPYNIPFILYKHDAYIGDNIAVDNTTHLRFVSSSKGVYYDKTDVNDIQYAVIVHGNIKSPDMDSIYRTIDDLYKRIGELESKI